MRSELRRYLKYQALFPNTLLWLSLFSCVPIGVESSSYKSETDSKMVRGTNHAILINGGGVPEAVRPNDLPDTLRMYRTLRSLGGGEAWNKTNIHVFQTNGNSHEPDKQTVEGSMVRQATDFDGDGLSDVSEAANLRNIRHMFENLANTVEDGDQLLIYTMSHGDLPNSNASEEHIVLWNMEALTVSELRRLLGKLKQSAPQLRIGMIMTQCFSGAFQALSDRNTCVISAADSEEESWAELEHMPFNSYATAAISQGRGSLTRVYDSTARRDWHAQWNDLSSNKMLRQMVEKINIPDYVARSSITISALGTGEWQMIANQIESENGSRNASYLEELERHVTLTLEHIRKLETYHLQLPDTFTRMSWVEQQRFIRDCHNTLLEVYSEESEVAGRYWGLSRWENRNFAGLSPDQKTALSSEWERFFDGTDDMRKLRGTCRWAHRISEQMHLIHYEEKVSNDASFDRYLEIKQACDQFIF